MDKKMDPRVNCHFCRRKLVRTKVDHTFPENVKVEDVPALKCSGCEEYFFE